jgi:predicted HTH domain antitoxin
MTITLETITPQTVLALARQLPPADQRWLADALREKLDDTLPEHATLGEAIELYLADRCSLGRAAELADVTQWDLQDILYERGIPTNGGNDLTNDEFETMIRRFEARYGRCE